MRRFRHAFVTTCTCFVALASVQCGQAGDASESEDSRLVIHLADGDERALGPMGLQWFYVYLGLVRNPGWSGDYEPRLMESWEHTPDYTSWTLHLRDDVRWGDGVPVTAEDVEFSLELWTNPNVAYEYRFYEGIEVLDSRTLQVTFTEPVSSTIFVYSWLPVLPRHLLDTLSVEDIYSWPFWLQPVGDGPYRYVKHIPRTMTELEANPDYYGELPSIPTVVLQYGGSGYTELISGNVDIASQITPLEALQLAADPRFEIYHRNDHDFMAIVWNHRNPLFQDAAVRRALTMSINRRGLHQLLNYPDDLPISDVPATKRHFAEGSVPEPLPFDPERAAQVFESVAWIDGDNNGIREKNGKEFQFTLSVTPETQAQAIYIQEQLRRAGIRMEISTFERSVLRERGRAHNFEAVIRQYNFVEQYRDFPVSGYVNPEVSRLAYTLWYTMDQDKADQYLREIWQIVATEIPLTYLHPRMSFLAAHRRVRGLQNDRFLSNIVQDLWIEDE
jgi:peptide/nickel transport system substrate-binding protein